jgi:hypothetical protein
MPKVKVWQQLLRENVDYDATESYQMDPPSLLKVDADPVKHQGCTPRCLFELQDDPFSAVGCGSVNITSGSGSAYP